MYLSICGEAVLDDGPIVGCWELCDRLVGVSGDLAGSDGGLPVEPIQDPLPGSVLGVGGGWWRQSGRREGDGLAAVGLG